jgi:NTP pyrophosphatase (non-canonical NTP hydrolase)
VKSLIDIADETARARELHGSSFEDGNDDKKLRRLVEEVGETAEAIERIDDARRYYLKAAPSMTTAELEIDRAHRLALRAHLRAELVQVASLAKRWIDQMDGVE